MKALPKLKDTGVFSRLRITDDHTIQDRHTISLWCKEAKARNANNSGNFTWKLRGSPSTKLRLVKVERKEEKITDNERTEDTRRLRSSTKNNNNDKNHAKRKSAL